MRRAIFVLILLAACKKHETIPGDPDRGKQLIAQYGCTSCHIVPGVKGPRGMVGPSLDHVASRSTIGGKFQNSVPTMTKWLQNPQAMDPASSMPNLGVTPEDARDMTAYLYTLR